MTYSTSYNKGTIAAAPTEASVIIRPKFLPVSTQQGVMFVHGAGSDATYCMVPLAEQAMLTRKIAAAGFNGWSHDNGGSGTPGGLNSWGNDTAISRLGAGRTYLQANLPVTPGGVACVSASMGGLNSFAWAAANPTQVSCLVSVIPVIDVSDIHTNNRGGYAPAINTAYGGAWSESAYGSTHNPLTMALAGKFSGLPMLIFYGLTDTLCLPAKTQAFATAVGPTVEMVPLASGHDFDSYAAVDQDRIVSFLKTHAT